LTIKNIKFEFQKQKKAHEGHQEEGKATKPINGMKSSKTKR
jgi:hypothetical protein